MEESWAYQFLDTCYTQPIGPTSNDLPSVCTILMVMACGTQFAHLESFHLTEQMADDSETPPYFSEDDIGQKFHQAARVIIPYILTTPSFYSVEACLMMATYNFPLDAAGASYLYLSLSLSLAVQLGMYRQRYYEGLSSIEAETQKRVWWTSYCLHLQAGIRHGRPKYLADSEVDVEKPVDIPELRPQKEVSSFDNQRGLIKLTLTTQAIADKIAALRKTNSSVQFLNLLSIQRNLSAWWEDFPGSCQPLSPTTSPRRLRNDIHLRLYYCTTRISLGRPFLLSVTTAGPAPEDSTTRQSFGRESLVQDCINAALEVISLCQMLRDRVGLARASYVTEFTSCRTAMLVLLAQSLAGHDPKVREALTRGLEIMKVMAIGSALANLEFRVIEVLERAVVRLEAATKDSAQDPNDSRLQAKSNYDAFKAWTRLWQPSSGFTPMASSFSPNTSGLSNDGSQERGFHSIQELSSHSTPLDHDPEQALTWGSFPLELRNFDIIPDFDLGIGGPGVNYEHECGTILLDSPHVPSNREFHDP